MIQKEKRENQGLSNEQKDILGRMIHNKTGLNENETNIATIGRLKAILNEPELWLMVEATIAYRDERSHISSGMTREGITDNNENWLAKVFVIFKMNDMDLQSDTTQRSLEVMKWPHFEK
jgi:hypothetical protein